MASLSTGFWSAEVWDHKPIEGGSELLWPCATTPLHSPWLGLATLHSHAGPLPAEPGVEEEVFLLVFRLRRPAWPCVCSPCLLCQLGQGNGQNFDTDPQDNLSVYLHVFHLHVFSTTWAHFRMSCGGMPPTFETKVSI